SLVAVPTLALAAGNAGVGRFATDPVTGYALGGHDPVAYFTDKAPRRGEAELEAHWRGVAWTFVNEGNRAAFVAAPEVYAPRFGGCAPYSLAEGYATTGNPLVFALYGERLYLFHSEVDRFLFLANPEHLRAEAEKNADRLECVPK